MKTLKTLFNLYRQPNWKVVFLWFISLTVIGFVLSLTAINDTKNMNLDFWEPWFWEYSSVYSFGLLCPILTVFCQKWLFDQTQFYTPIFKMIMLYFPFTFLFISLMLAVRYVVYFVIEGNLFNAGDLLERYIYEFPKTIPFYFAVVFGTYTKIYYETYQKEQIHAAKLNERLLIAQIDTLRNQLQPHFLFNTLNLISGTMYQDIDKADSIITRLGDLLRYSLASAQTPWITLHQEIDAMTSYLEISKLRFGNRIKTKMVIQTEANSVMVPTMLLQPLIENAIKYGIEPSDDEGEIMITAKLMDDKLRIVISNPRLSDTSLQPSFGIGLKNTKDRLSLLFGKRASISLKNTPQNIVALTLTLPANFINHQQRSI